MGRSIYWDLENDPDGNVQHVYQHGITIEEADEILEDPDGIEFSRSSGYPVAFGTAHTGRRIAVVFELIDEDSVRPITAFEI